MTLNANDVRDEYTASASQAVFNYTFKIYESTDLDVYVTPAGQECSDADLTTAYTVAGVGAEGGGTITLTTPAGAGDMVTIVSSIPTSRTTDYQNNGSFRPDTVNDDFDRAYSLVKQALDKTNRSLQFPACEQGVSSLSLPSPVANSFVRWKDDLSGLENYQFQAGSAAADAYEVSYNTVTVGTYLDNKEVADYAALRAVDISQIASGDTIQVSDLSRGGTFVWSSSNLSTEVTADTQSGIYVAPNSDATGASGAWIRRFVGDVHAKWFGAVFDGITAGSTNRLATTAALAFSAEKVILPSGTGRLDATIDIPANKKLKGAGKAATAIDSETDIIFFRMDSASDAWLEGVLLICDPGQLNPCIVLDASSATMTRCVLRDIQISGFGTTDFIGIQIRSRNGAYGNWAHDIYDIAMSGVGTMVRCETNAANSWINSINFSHIYGNDYIRAIDIDPSLGDGAANCKFDDWSAQSSARTQFGALIRDVSAAGISANNSFKDVRFYDFFVGGGTLYSIGANVQDIKIYGNITDDIIPTRVQDNGISTTVDGKPLFDYITRRGRGISIPTDPGLNESVSGTAATTANASYINLTTGATGGSVARRYSNPIAGLSQNNVLNVDWGKPFRAKFTVTRSTADPGSIARVQFKPVDTDGALSGAGVGVQISDLAIFGESYGSSVATVNLGTSMASDQSYVIEIIHYPTLRVEWWINNVRVSTQTTSANIPTGQTALYFHSAITNSGATDIGLWVSDIEVRASES